ncbi:hypothetical protein VMB_22780 [Vibrio mimicus VM603]|uniref:Uncharacterized protein n=2 Tax=Vibrio mimicus TaxID=674 RepID=D2YFI1_VIBMI|nr:hypothetical protein VMB_22780 [Vibrio mimicus VM603]
MPGSPQKTELTLPKVTSNTQVIEFHTPPEYRACLVDISKANKVEFFGFVQYKGKRRAWVTNITQPTKRCRVIVDACKFAIHQSYSGNDVSAGVKEL